MVPEPECDDGNSADDQRCTERHGGGRLAPPAGSPERGPFLQWIHFSEGTLYPPLGNLLWHAFYRRDADRAAEALR